MSNETHCVEKETCEQEKGCTTIIKQYYGCGYNDCSEDNIGGVGQDGKSAYEIAVKHGFSGTEEEWLKSLKGLDGNINEIPPVYYDTLITGQETFANQWRNGKPVYQILLPPIEMPKVITNGTLVRKQEYINVPNLSSVWVSWAGISRDKDNASYSSLNAIAGGLNGFIYAGISLSKDGDIITTYLDSTNSHFNNFYATAVLKYTKTIDTSEKPIFIPSIL